ncbi:MAG: amidohydrolase family protein [Chloroflexi bacterium]|nr:amidohydrolase family protein [Chloroflexota bacterium]
MTLTNAHTHLEGGWMTEICPDNNGQDFLPWIGSLIQRRNAKRDAGRLEALERAAIETGIQTLIDSGHTHIGDITLGGYSVEPLLASGLAGVVYVEAIGSGTPDAQTHFEHARAIIERWRPYERNGMRVGLTIHTPYSVSPRLWQLSLEYARKEALELCIHVAESPAEYAFLRYNSGPMTDPPWRSARDWSPPLKSPVAYLEDLGALELKPLLVHAVQVDDEDIARIKKYGCAVAHCPRSNRLLRCGRMPLEKFLAAGVQVYLGTDSLGSSPSIDVRDEIAAAVQTHAGIVDAATVEALAWQAL